MAPPGTPGEATIITPSIITNPTNMGVVNVMPCMSIRATAQAVIFMHEPLMWMVAHRGMAKSVTSVETFIRRAWRTVTGMVAAEDEVPRAVK